MRSLVEPHLLELIPYVPGKPISETEREYGVRGIAKLASNENCLGPSRLAIEAAKQELSSSHLYPDAGGYLLKERLVALHEKHRVHRDQIVLGNGTNELINHLVRALVGPDEALLNAWPSFQCYRMAAKACMRREVTVPLDSGLRYDLDALASAALTSEVPVKIVFLANPNNPTGTMFGIEELERFCSVLSPETVVVLDEAYAEYVTARDYPDGVALVQRRPRTVCLRTFSKIYGLAGMRIGYAVCDPQIADVLNRLRDPFNTSSAAQAAALAALDDKEHLERSRAHNEGELVRVSKGLADLGLDVTPSVANFVLASVKDGMPDVPSLNEALLRRGVIVRPVGNYGLTRAVRITIGTAGENDRLLLALAEILAEGAPQKGAEVPRGA